jgi:hypothetical protein
MGFWIATADTSGARITTSDLELQPGPSLIEYPTDSAGSILDTVDGNAIHQQPSRDGRRRVWVWSGYPHNQAGYLRVWPVLLSLRSRYRAEAGLSPYVFLKEDITGGLRRRQSDTGTGSATGFTLTDGTASWTANAFQGGFVVVAGQSRAVLANTATTITVGDAFVGSPSGTYVINYFTADWFRVRVLEVSRHPKPERTLQYESTRIQFVVDDPNSADLLG